MRFNSRRQTGIAVSLLFLAVIVALSVMRRQQDNTIEPTTDDGRRQLVAVFLNGMDAVDGNLEKPQWEMAAYYPLCLSRQQSDDKTPEEPGLFAAGWDEKHLYIAATFEDSDLLALGESDNEEHYRLGDVFELFIKPEFSDWYWELWITPKGHKTAVFWQQSGARGSDVGPAYALEFAAAVHVDGALNDSSQTDAGWQCEIQIPKEQLIQKGALEQKGQWLILAARQNYTGKVSPEYRELSAWPRLSRNNFHLTDEYALFYKQKPN